MKKILAEILGLECDDLAKALDRILQQAEADPRAWQNDLTAALAQARQRQAEAGAPAGWATICTALYERAACVNYLADEIIQ